MGYFCPYLNKTAKELKIKAEKEDRHLSLDLI